MQRQIRMKEKLFWLRCHGSLLLGLKIQLLQLHDDILGRAIFFYYSPSGINYKPHFGGYVLLDLIMNTNYDFHITSYHLHLQNL